MENDSLIDVIDGTTELFGIQGDGGGLFNLADEFIGDNEAEITAASARESGNLALSGNHPTVLATQHYAVTATTPSQMHTLVSHPLPPSVSVMGDLQKSAAGIVSQALVNPLQGAGPGVATQILQQGNQQFILKPGGQIQLANQAGSQLQFQQLIQPGMAASAGTQFQVPSSRAPSQSPAPSASPMYSRSLTPNSGGLVMSHASPSHSIIGGQFKSASPVPNVNYVHLPQGLQQPQQLQLAPGTVLQIPGSGGTQNIVNPAGLLQGQTTILGNQGQNIVNAQNTVIQNPNVVNVNVATHHVLCNNPQSVQSTQNPVQVQPQFQIQNQQKALNLGNIQTATQNPFNIQGTLIQTAEGKSILIPSQNISQPINIQNLQQLAMPTQLQGQGQLAGQPSQIAGQTLTGSAGNLLRLQQQQQESRSSQGLPQIVVNNAGQQVIIQRAGTPGSGQSSNIVVCTVPQSGLVQFQQAGIQAGPGQPQGLQVGSATIQGQPQGLQGGQAHLQAQQTNLQSIAGSHGQQFKIINQATSQGNTVPMINIGGQNVSLQQLSSHLGGNIQFVQQQQQPHGHVTSGHVIASQQGLVVSSQQGHGGGSLQGHVAGQMIGSGQDSLQGAQRRTSASPGHATLQKGQESNQMFININNLQNGQMHHPEINTAKVPQVVVSRKQKKSMASSQQQNRSSTAASKVNFNVVKQEVNTNTSVSSADRQLMYKNQLIIKQCENRTGSVPGIKREPQLSAIPSVVKQEPAVSTAIQSCLVKQEPELPNFLSTSTSLPLNSSMHYMDPSLESLFGSPSIALTSSFTTAQTTTTTTTVSLSSTSMSQFSMPNTSQNLVSSVQVNQASIPSPYQLNTSNINSSSVTSNVVPSSSVLNKGGSQSHAKPGSSATLQTIHLPPEIQQQFQRVRQEMEMVNKQTDLTPQQRQSRLQQLNIFQRKILLKGRVLTTTKAEPHHIQQGLQSLSRSGLFSSSANTSATSQHDNKPTVSQQVPSLNQTVLHSSANTPVPHSHSVTSPQVQEHKDQELPNSARGPLLMGYSRDLSQNVQRLPQTVQETFQNIASPVQNAQNFPQHVQNVMQTIANSANSVIGQTSPRMSQPHSESSKTDQYLQLPDSTTSIGRPHQSTQLVGTLESSSQPAVQTLSGLLTMSKKSTHHVPSPYSSDLTPTTVAASSASLPHATTPTTTCQSSITGAAGSSQGPSSVPAGALHTAASLSTSGETTVTTSPQVAVPTQIKIADKVLTLSLTPAQKEKVQSYLDRMDHEQQQQYLQTQQGVLQRIQRQQQLNAQIRAQVEAQKRQQQQQQQAGGVDAQKQPSLAGLISQKLQLQQQQRGGGDAQHPHPSHTDTQSDTQMGGDNIHMVPQSGVSTTPPLHGGASQVIVPLLQPKTEIPSPSTHQQMPEPQMVPIKVEPSAAIKSGVTVIPVPNIQIRTSPPTESPLRGTKRSFMDIPKGTLINQQIKQDQNHATDPDTKRPFRSRGDACRRLLRYHVFQGNEPSKQEFDKFDAVVEDAAQTLLSKKDRMVDRFRYLLMQESMRGCASSELVMLQRIQNQDLRKLIEDEKRTAADNPDAFIPMAKNDTDEAADGGDNDVNTSGSGESDPADNNTGDDADKKVKKLVIKSDGMNFSSSFKRQSLDSNRSLSSGSGDSEGEDSGTLVNVSDDGAAFHHDSSSECVEIVEEEIITDFNIEQDQDGGSQFPVIRGSCDLTNDDDSDTNEYNGEIPMQEESDNAVLTISSAEDSQDDTLVNDSMDQSSQNMSMSYAQNSHSVNFGDHPSSETKTSTAEPSFQRQLSSGLASQSDYFHKTTEQNGFEFFNMSHISSNKTSHTYVPDHSPVSNDSIDDNANNSAATFSDSAHFSNLHMYQPITESLTDSEENSYYSADNSAEQNSVTVDDTDTDRHGNKNTKWDQSKTIVHIDSDSEPADDSDPDVKAQMESAINSILSLGQGAPLSASFDFHQSNHMYTNNTSRGDSSGQSNTGALFTVDHGFPSGYHGDGSQARKLSDSDVLVQSSPIGDDSANDDVIVVDSDLDAAVQSILM